MSTAKDYAQLRRSLELQLEVLRKQEARIQHAVDVVCARSAASLAQSGQPSASYQDLESFTRDVRAEQQRRECDFWNEVRKAIRQVKKQSLVSQWFGIPVRESAWGQDERNWALYCAKVTHPMDLSTILQRLGEDDNTRQYKHPEEVCRDVRLVVYNCETFNVGDSGDQVRRAARTLQTSWERRWQPNDGTGLQQLWHNYDEIKQAENLVLEEFRKTSAQHREWRPIFEERKQEVLKTLPEAIPCPPSTHSWEAKRKLAIQCTALTDWTLSGLLELVQSMHDLGDGGANGEVELNLDLLPDEVLDKMQLYVEAISAKRDNKSKAKNGNQAKSNDASASVTDDDIADEGGQMRTSTQGADTPMMPETHQPELAAFGDRAFLTGRQESMAR